MTALVSFLRMVSRLVGLLVPPPVFFRGVGVILLIAAIVSGASVLTHVRNDPRRALMLPTVEVWKQTSTPSYNAAHALAVAKIGAKAWDGVVLKVLEVPPWLLLGVSGGLLLYFGRRRRTVNIYAN